ncbi:MAG TPA: nucleoside-diphosphate kinase [Candidatus Babeliales bacterium]|jgi:nucleoside-diphosphate kinase|nr:nucleoside-diphosphate kinase [Candidatus Babeliales bacterium]
MELTKITFAMIKPDAVAAKNSGKIIDMIERNGFEIIRMQKVIISADLAEEFYAVHKERPFFGELVEFVVSGPVVIMALHKDDAINAWRELIGATDPSKAAEGTVRRAFGTSIGNNAVHGSDSSATALTELQLFFPDLFEYPAECSDDKCDDEDECEDQDEEDDNN